MSPSASNPSRPLDSLLPTETLDLTNGLSLTPQRLKLLLTVFRSDPSVKPLDEWQLKRSLLDFLHDSLSLSVPEDDLDLRRCGDLKKHKREDPVASGTLYVRDLGFLKRKRGREEDWETVWGRFKEWKVSVVDRMDGIDLNLEGLKFRLSVAAPPFDDFDAMKRSWEEFHAFSNGNRRVHNTRGGPRRPDTIVVQGVPTRWFAEPRVSSSKASLLVTHTIFSVFGNIRKLNVAADDDLGKTIEGGIVSGLQSKVWVQFEKYEDFCNALKLLCGRSMQKQGSRLKADYEVTWDKDDVFRSTQQIAPRIHVQERLGPRHEDRGQTQVEAPRVKSQITSGNNDRVGPKRWRD
ncbi:hypothetical protein QJS10_CPA02g00406 [Acorus calamus]|uniref:A-kinase anchor protein 17A n=1 Tax=Acorus calamus TaxID=4465 RepID=A0AAV9FCM8_ACOCL|nr:hypothetical protein QJS10_CPA02g00406 [Acorus calamus]